MRKKRWVSSTPVAWADWNEYSQVSPNELLLIKSQEALGRELDILLDQQAQMDIQIASFQQIM